MFSLLNAQAAIAPGSSTIELNDPGFQTHGNEYLAADGCTGKGKAMTVFGNIPCNRLDVGNDEDTCNTVEGCQWQNRTAFFNLTVFEAECELSVNLSHYSLEGTSKSNYCETFTNESYCDIFECVWADYNTLATDQVNLIETGKVVTIWETVKFMAGFQVDLNLGTFNFLFVFLFFYLPFVMLIWSMYMALPFFH